MPAAVGLLTSRRSSVPASTAAVLRGCRCESFREEGTARMREERVVLSLDWVRAREVSRCIFGGAGVVRWRNRKNGLKGQLKEGGSTLQRFER